MDSSLAAVVMIVTAYALGIILTLLITYWIIRLAVGHALRSHEYWKRKTFKGSPASY